MSGLSRSGTLLTDKDGLQSALSTRAILDVYKYIANLLGLNAIDFSCHSTRVGAVHDMGSNNINMPAVKQAGGWKSDVMPSRYMKRSDARKGAMAQMEAKEKYDPG